MSGSHVARLISTPGPRLPSRSGATGSTPNPLRAGLDVFGERQPLILLDVGLVDLGRQVALVALLAEGNGRRDAAGVEVLDGFERLFDALAGYSPVDPLDTFEHHLHGHPALDVVDRELLPVDVLLLVEVLDLLVAGLVLVQEREGPRPKHAVGGLAGDLQG